MNEKCSCQRALNPGSGSGSGLEKFKYPDQDPVCLDWLDRIRIRSRVYSMILEKTQNIINTLYMPGPSSFY